MIVDTKWNRRGNSASFAPKYVTPARRRASWGRSRWRRETSARAARWHGPRHSGQSLRCRMETQGKLRQFCAQTQQSMAVPYVYQSKRLGIEAPWLVNGRHGASFADLHGVGRVDGKQQHLPDEVQVNDAPCPPLTSHGASIMLQKQQHLPDEVQQLRAAKCHHSNRARQCKSQSAMSAKRNDISTSWSRAGTPCSRAPPGSPRST
jgi:hypothetical protein